MTDPHDMARRMMNASVCAYQIYEKDETPTPNDPALRRVSSPDGKYFYQVVPAYQDAVGFIAPSSDYAPAFLASGDDLIDGAFVGLTHDGYALVSIRGTLPPSFHNHNILEWVRDWVNDARMHPVSWTPNGRVFGNAERGFASATLAIWDWVRETLGALLAQAPEGVLVTGHSKGGAMTYLLASLIGATWPELEGRIEVHAFAPAVSGNSDFVEAYKAAGLAQRTFRYQVEQDLVPFVPLWQAADVWQRVFETSPTHKLEWGFMFEAAKTMTHGGYEAPGSFTFFNRNHELVPGARVSTSALPAVVKAIIAGHYSGIGKAHSATDSYLKCFLKG